MSIRSNLALTVAPARRNEIRNQTLNRLVSIDDAFDRALHSGGLHVSDGSLYEPDATTAAEPAIDLIEEVTAKALPFTAPADCSTHLRLRYSGGPDRYVSFSPKTFTEQDDYRQFLCVELGRVYLDGIEIEPGNLDEQLDESLEGWVLGRRAA